MSKKILTISIISIIILALIGGGAVWYLKTQKQEFTPSDDLGTVNPAVTENEDRQSAIENQKSEIINTDDWLTYRNEEYGFELKYPREWEINTTKSTASFYYLGKRKNLPEGGGSIDFSVSNINLSDFIQQYNASDIINKTLLAKIIDQEDYILDGNFSKKLIGSTAIGINRNFIFSSKNGKSYIISFHDFDKEHLAIVSTFKFIK